MTAAESEPTAPQWAKRILRNEVPVDDAQHLIGAGAVVHIATRAPKYPRGDVVEVWTVEHQAGPHDIACDKTRRVQVVGTGHPFPVEWTPLGSCLALDGVLVWHVCEVPA